ncbi:hypothetical protein FACS1894147_03130 [Spirochaetia bacterium]|nr:hypothetical protein FACS1894147_03130 [Spirochaetia bacterium]
MDNHRGIWIEPQGDGRLDFSAAFADTYHMDIQSASIEMNQQRVQEQAAVQVAAMSLDAAKEQGAALAKLLESAAIVTDPARGQNLNLLG